MPKCGVLKLIMWFLPFLSRIPTYMIITGVTSRPFRYIKYGCRKQKFTTNNANIIIIAVVRPSCRRDLTAIEMLNMVGAESKCCKCSW